MRPRCPAVAAKASRAVGSGDSYCKTRPTSSDIAQAVGRLDGGRAQPAHQRRDDRHEHGEAEGPEKMFGQQETQGAVETELKFQKKGPTVFMMAGLQGSGKTTTCGQLARDLMKKGRR